MRKKIIHKKITALFLLMAICLEMTAGCGKNEKEECQVELLEPAFSNDFYRPCEKGIVGNINFGEGVVVPKSYCNFYKTNTAIGQLCVDLGDYVEAGQVLAKVDEDSVKNDIEDLKVQQSLIQSKKPLQDHEYAKQTDYLRKGQEIAVETQDGNLMSEMNKQISVNEENHRYDQQLYDYEIKRINEKMSEKEKLLEDGILKAGHSGYVTYVKDMQGGGLVNGYENVVIVSDINDLYIDMPWITTNNRAFAKCESIFTKIGGKQVALKPYAYTDEEMALSTASKQYPHQRFIMPEGLSMGDTVPVYFMDKAEDEGLIVGRDSLFKENDQYFVYVKTDKSDMEKRNVEIGEIDTAYAQVLSGLNEGEWVYYSSQEIPPSADHPYKVNLEDFTIDGNSNMVEDACTRDYLQYSDVTGIVTDVYVKPGDSVKKGDKICRIDIGEGQADTKKAILNIEEETQSFDLDGKDHTKALQSLSNDFSELSKQKEDLIKNIKKQKNKIKKKQKQIMKNESVSNNTIQNEGEDQVTNLQEAIVENEKEIKILDLSMNQILDQSDIENTEWQIRQLEHDSNEKSLQTQAARLRKQVNGDGSMTVLSNYEGVVGEIKAEVDKKVKEEDMILRIGVPVSSKLRVTVMPQGITNMVPYANVGTLVTFKTADKREIQAKSIALSMDLNKFHFSKDGDKTVITRSIDENTSFIQFYVDAPENEKEEILGGKDVSFAAANIKACIAVPKELVYKENSQKKTERFFVWKIKDGHVFQQFVTINDAFTSNGKFLVLQGLSDGDELAGTGGEK